MASVTEEGGGTANDGARERQRFTGHKVYTRKAFKGSKKADVSTTTNPSSTTTTATATTNDSRTDEKEINITTTAPVATTATTDDQNRNSDGDDVNACSPADAPTTVTTSTNDSHEKQINITNTTPFASTTAEINVRDANPTTSSAPAAATSTTTSNNNNKDVCLLTTVSPDAITATTTTGIENNNKDGDNRNKESNSLNLTDATTYLDNDNTGTILPANFTSSNGKKDDNVDTDPTQQQEPQTSYLEDSNLAQHFRPSKGLHADAAVVDDSLGLNRQVVINVPGTENGAVKQGLEDRVKINLMSTSKREVRELRRKLENELDMVRSLVKKIEAKQGQLGFDRLDNSQVLVNNGVVDGLKRVNSGVISGAVPIEDASIISTPTPRQTRPLNQLRVPVLENSQGTGEIVEKEKRTPKANQFYRNSEFLLAKDKFPPAESNKKSKLNGKKQGAGESGAFGSGTKIFKQCSSLLERLLKHRHAWVFKAPVDVEGLGLHDYYTIITHPMDLGTVKTRLHKNLYKSSEEFAEDVRLTFHNAMRYNPKGHDVHVMAEELLEVFEKKWAVVKLEHDRETRLAAIYNTVTTSTPRKPPILPPPPLDMRKILDRSESMTYPVVDVKPKPFSTTPSGRTPLPKKPKAKDPHKRDMTYEEKQKLSTNLSSLPPEKLDSIVHIIKKRNSTLLQHDEEIEVDIDSVDTETLWELDRFVMNYKKSLSKNKRKAEIATQARAQAAQNASEKVPAPGMVEATKETITEGKNVSGSSPVQVDQQEENGSRSSSSSSSSSDSGSSSSDSDSDSSSESGSDVGH